MHEAEIDRKLTVLWNVMPWWNRMVRFGRQERSLGLACVSDFIERLPQLRVVMLVGRQRARPYLQQKGLEVFTSDHPSPKARARYRDGFNAIPQTWADVLKFTAKG
jgi:hypothetical protein